MNVDSLVKIHGINRRAHVILWVIIAMILIFMVWSYFAVLNEVAIGEGKVMPASKGQIIQNLEGGILAELMVREGDEVKEGQILASLDPAKAKSNVDETLAKIVALKARAARLDAEMNNQEKINYPQDIRQQKEVIDRETQLFYTNRQAFKENVLNLTEQVKLAENQVEIAKPLLKTGAASEVEVLKLQQNAAELSSRLAATKNEYYVALRGDFTKTMADLEPLLKAREGLADQLTRTVIRAPTRGIVKDIRVTTIGGVVAPGGTLMEIVPLGDQLLIEAKLNPRDIAFIHKDQKANVKITAYDSAIYGSLPGHVQMVSPDSIEDDVDKRVYYYRAYILTDHSYLETKDGKKHQIIPGMVATAEISTGEKTVLDYLIKPLNRAKEALRER
ncbi:HlyD family efflux transporter periplasmic adaptor subunit [Bartonella sp. W8122]|uniref:HlyD family efflux transporter periplasmic adaptor subunit n=1 Tax=Bartonella TaxID=773 RepID=UPI0018DBD055|nr:MULTISPECIES: HlyD family efflux transporter periplasmic adaptor subunit [Bartonella]MBI0002188.1 HlyD family efflux transporter periplasmic adaptor subunit [Bartonella sp. W8122]MBI0021053.1 HlyD family efflux transporter periplasmic adaptor subunit [Bartonella apihabitans]MBI0166349.1 HlyD family efflux transporter periplasmic adaptor subunit [Bartonella apihabitans]